MALADLGGMTVAASRELVLADLGSMTVTTSRAVVLANNAAALAKELVRSE